jgi:hypothetical protein
MTGRLLDFPPLVPSQPTADPDAGALLRRAATIRMMLEQIGLYLHYAIEQAADCAPVGAIDRKALDRSIDAYLGDLKGELVGSIEAAADMLTEERR